MSNPQPGQMLGPYQIISQVGKGGMATVYKAYHAAMDRYVAVKILPHEFMHNDLFLGHFRQEVRVIAKLEHKHILPVYDYGESVGGLTSAASTVRLFGFGNLWIPIFMTEIIAAGTRLGSSGP